MSKQVWAREFGCVTSATDGGFGLGGTALGTSPSEGVKCVIPANGTIDKLTVSVDTAVAASASKIFTLNVNGSSSALTGTIAAGQTQVVCTGGPISVSAGDIVYVAYTHTGTPGANTLMTVSWVFNGSSSGESIYIGSNAGVSTTTPAWMGAFNPGNATSTTAAIDAHNVCSAPGTITKLYATLAPAAGAVGQYKFTIYKNGTAQDGTSGTPDTRLTLTNVASTRVTSNSSFSLSVAAGDTVYVQIDSLSSPSSKTAGIGLAFTATNAGESNVCWAIPTIPGASSSTSYNGPHSSVGATGWNTEGSRLAIVADKFKLYNLRIVLSAAPGGATSRSFINRKNSGSGTITVTLTTVTTGSDLTHQDNYAALDTICFFESAVSGSPAAAQGTVGFTQFIQGGNPPGKSQQGSKKGGGGGVNLSVPGGTQLLFTNLGLSTQNN